jgi:hypothetical protein
MPGRLKWIPRFRVTEQNRAPLRRIGLYSTLSKFLAREHVYVFIRS